MIWSCIANYICTAADLIAGRCTQKIMGICKSPLSIGCQIFKPWPQALIESNPKDERQSTRDTEASSLGRHVEFARAVQARVFAFPDANWLESRLDFARSTADFVTRAKFVESKVCLSRHYRIFRCRI